MNIWLAFWIGTIVGSFFALFLIAICKAAGDADYYEEEYDEEH